ncbi:MAG: hypothetical protein OEZ22_01210 [Spirochaetia bacterium]|nr:hypothetical protein [Spirochaetia bacterium]
MRKKFILFWIIFLLPAQIMADVISTKDGIILNGTIKKKNKNIVIFESNLGTFEIEQEKIEELKVIKDKKESLEVYEKLKEKWKKSQEAEPSKKSFIHNFDIGFRYLKPQYGFSKIFDYGYGVFFSLNFNLKDNIWQSKKAIFPDFKLMITPIWFEKSVNSLRMLGMASGPVWRQEILRDSHLKIYFIESLTIAPMYSIIKVNEKFKEFAKLLIQPDVSIGIGYRNFLTGFSITYFYSYDGFIPLSSLAYNLYFKYIF